VHRNYAKDIEFVTDLKHLKDMKKKICNVEGSFLRNLIIDGKTYWEVDDVAPQRQLTIHEDEAYILASDWRYREDLLWLKYNYELIAHQWKVRLEVQQRHDRAKR